MCGISAQLSPVPDSSGELGATHYAVRQSGGGWSERRQDPCAGGLRVSAEPIWMPSMLFVALPTLQSRPSLLGLPSSLVCNALQASR
jgi:hypothetical protein